jgi:hypothetical protein
MKTRIWSMAVSTMLLGGVAQAREPHRHGPPQEAVAACASSSTGATCSFTAGDRTVTGTCETHAGGSELACRPVGPPPGHHGPPQEAVAACASSAVNASCSFAMGDHTVTGTCETHPGGSELACRPSGPPPGHHGPSQEAVKACAGLSANAACAFVHGSTNLTGTCVAPPDDSAASLACRPDRPDR